MESKVINLNPQIYPLDVIYAAAYVLLDRSYIFIDGNPNKVVKITLTPKEKKDDADNLAQEFNNLLITYAFYNKQSKKNSALRQIMMQAALLSAEKTAEGAEDADKAAPKNIELPEDIKDANFLEDPEGIAVPWEIKYKKSFLGKKLQKETGQTKTKNKKLRKKP